MKRYNIKTMTLLLSVIVFVSCESQNSDIADSKTDDDVLLSETLNLNVVLSQYGQAKQIAQAPRMLQFSGKEGKYTTFPDGIYVESFTDSLVLESTIAAKFAKMKDGRDEFYSAYDSVVVTNYLNSTKIITDTLYWDRVNGKISNSCFTKFFINGGSFDAIDGWTSNQNLSDYEIRTIREGDLTIDRQKKASDSINQNVITFPDTADIQPKPQLQPKPQTKPEPQPADNRQNIEKRKMTDKKSSQSIKSLLKKMELEKAK
jgi:hypothetical protein